LLQVEKFYHASVWSITHGECDTLKAMMTIVIIFLRGYLGSLCWRI